MARSKSCDAKRRRTPDAGLGQKIYGAVRHFGVASNCSLRPDKPGRKAVCYRLSGGFGRFVSIDAQNGKWPPCDGWPGFDDLQWTEGSSRLTSKLLQ